MVSTIILWIFLGINTVTDLKKRIVYMPVIFLFAVLGVVFYVCKEKQDMGSLIGGVLAGVFLLLFSVVTSGAVGAGDGWVVAVTGIWLGGWKTVFVMMGGFILTALCGVAGIVIKKANRKSELPFVPFFALSYVIILIGECL